MKDFSVHSLIKYLMIRTSGNRCVQNLLEANVLISQMLMGIGAGGGVFTSGEQCIIDILCNEYMPPYCIFDVGQIKGNLFSLF